MIIIRVKHYRPNFFCRKFNAAKHLNIYKEKGCCIYWSVVEQLDIIELFAQYTILFTVHMTFDVAGV